jgi:2-polyprenyl-3-methyl-5-hydroxy-6-metoxy-1,4-benzoquinol methylase
MVADALHEYKGGCEVVVDVGCGAGNLKRYLNGQFSRYIGIDAIRYENFPDDGEFGRADLDAGRVPLPDNIADAVISVETIEHLENPRAFVRELVRLVKPGGCVVITTPNQLSLLSLVTLIAKHRFSAFQDPQYPAHITALLEIDLRRIAGECHLIDLTIQFSRHGRLVLTPWHYPKFLSYLFPRTLSDNVLLMGRKEKAS